MHLLYLDPGNGSLIAQIIGGLLGTTLLFFNQIKHFFRRKNKNHKAEDIDEE